jgi:L,D-transpeptidase catalytic domain
MRSQRLSIFGQRLCRIHGTNEPSTIGQNLSPGCVRMMNDDVIDLYERMPVGAKVIVLQAGRARRIAPPPVADPKRSSDVIVAAAAVGR